MTTMTAEERRLAAAESLRKVYDDAPKFRLTMCDPDEWRIVRAGDTIKLVHPDGREVVLPVDTSGTEAAARLDLSWGPTV
jgi:hypothetical protein